VAFYAVYTAVRNHFGSASVPATEAYANARTVIGIEQALGIFHEAGVQSVLAGSHLSATFWNTFYGSLHFVVTIGTLIHLFRRFPTDYRHLRNVLVFSTALALVGFSLFPLMPPRLLCDCPFGAGAASQAEYGFVDTLARDGSLWSFGSSGVKAISNQYAAMPSLHFAWALWCALALYPRLRHRHPRAALLAAIYPALTLLAVTATGNHFWLDALGGALVIATGWTLAGFHTRWVERNPKTASSEFLSRVLVHGKRSGVP